MRRIASSLAVSIALALAAPAVAETVQAPEQVAADAPAQANPPRLIVAVSIDQFSSDTFAQFRQHYSGGFVRLINGVVFPSGYQSHAATETCPGHSTLLTGTHPARNGIIANTWYEPDGPRGDKPVYCAEDQSDPASSPRNPVVSARNLKVPTLGEMMKSVNPASRNVAVSAKDRAVVMMGGHKIDAGWWWKGGSFVSFRGTAPTAAVQAVNAKAAATIKAGAKAMPIPVWCKAADRAVPVGKTTLGTGRFALEAGKENQFRISPRMDAATVDLAIGLADEMNLGKGAATTCFPSRCRQRTMSAMPPAWRARKCASCKTSSTRIWAACSSTSMPRGSTIWWCSAPTTAGSTCPSAWTSRLFRQLSARMFR